MAEQHSRQVPCALVAMGSGEAGRAGEVVVVFASPGEADEFARRHGLDDWTVAPVRLSADLDDIRRQQLARGRSAR